MSRIGDLIEVPAVKTVIQMADIEEPELRDFLTESFLLTDEVKQILESFFNNIINEQGKGFFVEGNYGSGKSHLLTVISLLLSHRESWQPLLEQDNISDTLREQKDKIISSEYLVVNISLVEHSSRERLEEIVTGAIINTLNNKKDVNKSGDKSPDNTDTVIAADKDKAAAGDTMIFAGIELQTGDSYKRREFFRDLNEVLTASRYRGLVILIDELSEFLRSKTDGRTFNEDIRFLQYLGEFFTRTNCWLMATLQEGIEKTGEITQEVFGKIKDRYPSRFHLTGTHIEEIISKRLIRLKAGARDEILRIYKHYRNSFSDWKVGKDTFLQLYPVNPRSIELLDNLKPLFSQHRGIIDFIHYRLQGDPSRNIPGMLPEPAENLLNPDLIFDHFLDRLRETMETRQYYEKAYRYYEQEIDSILSEDETEIGLKLIKMLILLAVSPLEKRYNVKEISHLLLKPVTDLDAAANYEYINDLLQRLYRHGAYLVLEKGNNARENTYYLDLKADVNLIIEQKTEYIKSNFFAEEQRIFTETGKLINEKYLPLAELLDRPKSIRRVYWQNTERQGYFLLVPVTDITLKGIAEFNKRLQNMDSNSKGDSNFKDFVIFTGYPLHVEEQEEYIHEVIIPELAPRERSSYCFWLPEELDRKELLQNVLARQLLLEEYREKSGETALAVKEKLQDLLKEDRNNIIDIFRRAFFGGRVIDGSGEEILNLEGIGIIPFNRLLDKITAILLENRFPRHYNIAPYQSVLNDGRLNRLCQHFLETGEMDKKTAAGQGILKTIEDVLKPMDFVKSRGNKIRVDINPGKNPLLKEVFSCLREDRTDINDIYKSLRKGDYGLARSQFKLVVLVLLYTGYLTAFSEKQKIAISQLTVYNFDRIKYLGYGEIIDDDFQRILADCSLLPPRFTEQPFSLPLQQEIWTYLTDLKRETVDEIKRVKVKLTNLTIDGELEYINHRQLLNNLDKVKELYDEIKVSYSAEEGLERFAASYSSTPNIDNYLERYQLIKEFVDEGCSKLVEMKNYLGKIPEDMPDRGKFPEIREIKEELLEGLQDQAVVFDAGFLEGLLDRFEYLKQLYIEEYYTEHQKQLAGERFNLYLNIDNRKDYQVLNRLSGIELISVRDDLIKIQRITARVLRQKCSVLTREHLKRSPLCSCGFKPGEQFEHVSLEEIHGIIARGIVQYLLALDSGEYRSKIEDYLDNMEAVGEKRFARPIRELLQLAAAVSRQINEENKEDSINSRLVENLHKVLNRNVINRINQALAGNVSMIERNLDHLYENLVGRSFSIEQIRQIFNDWLEKDQSLDQYNYVKVVADNSRGENEADRGDGQLLEDFLEEYYPELLVSYDRLGEEKFSLFTAAAAWVDLYNIDIEEMSGITSWSGELYGEINTDTIYQFWDKLSADENIPVENRVKDNIRKQVRSDRIIEKLVEIIPLTGMDDLIKVLEQEFISYDLISRIVVLVVKQIEKKGLSGQDLSEYKDRLEAGLKKTSDEEKGIYLEMVNSYLQLQASLSGLEGSSKPSTPKEWNLLYRRHLSHLEYNISKFRKLVKKCDLEGEIPVELLVTRVRKILNEYQQKFYEFSKKKIFRIKEEAGIYLVGEEDTAEATPDKADIIDRELDLSGLIIKKYPEMVKRMNYRDNCCLLLDGMRHDLWKLIKKELTSQLALRVIKEGSLYANLPSNTETQLDSLKENGYRGKIINFEDYSINEGNFNRKPSKNSNGLIEEIVKFSYIDDKIHTSKEGYNDFLEEIIFQTKNRLLPFMEKIPDRTMILIISDHGFRINHNFRKEEKYDTPRYLHGGNSPQEVIVPWALLYKI